MIRGFIEGLVWLAIDLLAMLCLIVFLLAAFEAAHILPPGTLWRLLP